MRGRGRKGPNLLSRSFESNGPDVKVRGTAMHIAEKYQQLARDAQASGDRIMAENYYQHAEHYSRIVAAAQGPSAQPSFDGRGSDDDRAGDGDGDVDTPVPARSSRAAEKAIMPEDAPQPFIDGMPETSTKRQPVNGNGAAAPDQDAEASAEGDGDEQAKPRRRTRGTRGRGTRRAAPVAAGEDGDAPAAEVSDA